ncbi:MAG: S8 family peptidase [Candidatus Sericytochromatia bacterium]|nr:S8 family peptidase [Candidatus Sericytochromatia bacterium]
MSVRLVPWLLLAATLVACGHPTPGVRWREGQPLLARQRATPEVLFVKLKPDAAQVAGTRLAAAHGLRELAGEQPLLAKMGWRAWRRQAGTPEPAQLRARLQADPAVAEVAFDEAIALVPEAPRPPAAPAFGPAATGPDPLAPRQWAVAKLQLEAAHRITTSSPRVMLAILDSGVDWTHPDLATADGLSRVVKGRDTLKHNDEPHDGHGHGTHAAGIAAASANNGVGVVGVAPNCRILAEKVVSDYGYGDVASVAAGIVHAVDQGAQVLSMSLGSPTPNPVVRDAVLYAQGKGAVLVAAMGNSGHEDILYPAAFPGVIAVGATRSDDTRASFSSFGDWISVAAPGDNIVSTVPSHASMHPVRDYGWMSGTSMATPHVAGLAALLRDLHPDWTFEQVKQRIEQTATPLGGSAFNKYFGHGRIDVYRAVKS